VSAVPVESFAALDAVAGVLHGFTGRVPGLDVQTDRAAALQRLAVYHEDARRNLGVGHRPFAIGEQVHGREIAVVDASTKEPVPGVDGVITADPDVCLGVYVADCCAVYLADPVRRVIALLHSGRKGSELGITTAAIEKMQREFGSVPTDIVVQLSPCIRPPIFESDFAALIVAQARAAGVREVHDSGICTASNLDRYYSYRAERGKTGRMLALLALKS